MTFAIASWFGRAFAAAVRSAPKAQRDEHKPMKIEVERMPDYRWRALGFPQPRRPGEDR